MNISIKSMHIENFKGITKLDVNFGDKSEIRGANASGKTTVVDAFLWLLFNKNSQYVEKFDLRPLDHFGEVIHYVDITVSSIIAVDGKEYELKKVQKERWVKQRGSEKAEYKGNDNSYEIDGYPKSDREFKDFVASLIPEDIFKILTSPTYFPSMKWKDQREILMKFATTESDVEFANRIGGYEDLLDDLERASNTTDIAKKYGNQLKELKAKQAELPVRIDEISKHKVDYDVAELELEKKELESRANPQGSDIAETLSNLKKDHIDIEFEKSRIAMNANSDNKNRSLEIRNTITEKHSAVERKKSDVNVLEYAIRKNDSNVEMLNALLKEQGERYLNAKNSKFDENGDWKFDVKSTYCKMCGQKLPESQIELIKSDFEERKAKAEKQFKDDRETVMRNAVEKGNTIKAEITKCNAENEEHKSDIERINAEIAKLTEEISTLNAENAKIPQNVDVSTIPEYVNLVNRDTEIVAKIATLTEEVNKAMIDRSNAVSELDIVNRKLAEFANNEAIDERIEALKAEQRDVSQKIANAEKIVYLLENFIKAKLDNVSAEINGKFKLVNFKLFDTAINGGITETCECTMYGVPYGDLNSAGKIQAGLDIIDTLSNIYGKNAPIFIDNRESCTDIPDMTAQTISLYVDPSYKYLTVKSV